MTPAAFLSAFAEAIANDGALILLVLLILWMGARKKWYWSWTVERLEAQLTDERVEFMERLNEMREERDGWRRISLMQQGQRGPEPGHPHESRLDPQP